MRTRNGAAQVQMEARQDALEHQIGAMQAELQQNRTALQQAQATMQQTQATMTQILVAVQANMNGGVVNNNQAAGGCAGGNEGEGGGDHGDESSHKEHTSRVQGGEGNEQQEEGSRRPRGGTDRDLNHDIDARIKRRLEELEGKIANLQPEQNDDLDPIGRSAFADQVATGDMPRKFKLPQLEKYRDQDDPVDFILTYHTRMDVSGANDVALCRAFPSVLERAGNVWFRSLRPASIHSFRELSSQFVSYFQTSKKRHELEDSLLTIRQGKGEMLKEYMERFTTQTQKILNVNPAVALTSAKAGLRPSLFQDSLIKRPALTYEEFLARAEKYIRLEENKKRE